MDLNLMRQQREDRLSGRELHLYRRGAGFTFSFLPRPGFSGKFFAVSIPFGSLMRRLPLADGSLREIPAGCAHFLEHLIFLNSRTEEGRNALKRLEALGADVNAYTSYDHTLFYLRTAEHIEEAAEALLDLVLHPRCSREAFENEKEVIKEELRLVEEEAEAKLYAEMMKRLFLRHPIRDDIAGTCESVAAIDPEILQLCHEYYYRKDRCDLVIVGDVDEERMLRRLVPMLEGEESERHCLIEGEDAACLNVPLCASEGVAGASLPLPCYGEEKPVTARIELDIERDDPYVIYAVRDPFAEKGERLYGLALERRRMAAEICFGLLFGSSSPFHESLNREGLLDESYFWEYVCFEDIGYFAIGGYTKDADRFLAEVRSKLAHVLESGELTEEVFERRKKMLLGNYLRQMDSVEELGFLAARWRRRNIDRFYYHDLSESLHLDDARTLLRELLQSESKVEIAARPVRDVAREDGTGEDVCSANVSVAGRTEKQQGGLVL